MLNYSTSEENHIKAIYHLQKDGSVTTNELAAELKTRPASHHRYDEKAAYQKTGAL
ncbi:MAG: hypothetical protein QM781_15340 [Chitinophagaceae bacterium]